MQPGSDYIFANGFAINLGLESTSNPGRGNYRTARIPDESFYMGAAKKHEKQERRKRDEC